MRIISGEYKGRVIKMPKGIRPTQNKVRKALFDILGDIEGLSFLELFAGSGAVGFEAVSKGASNLTLVEHNRDCRLAIQKNIAALKLKTCNLYPLQVDGAIKSLHKEKKKFDIIFLDPPYSEGLVPRHHASKNSPAGSGSTAEVSESLSKKTLQTLSCYDILTLYGFIVVQHFKQDNLPDAAGDLTLFRQKKYGDTVLSFYKKILQPGTVKGQSPSGTVPCKE